MRASDEVFRVADQIVAVRPWTPDGLGKLTGARLERVGNESNEFLTVYRAAIATGVLQSVELRVPTPASGAKGNLVLLQVRAASGIAKADVQSRFGEPAGIRVPPPHATAVPTYLDYARPWGRLTFGFNSSGNRELVRVVLDAAQ